MCIYIAVIETGQTSQMAREKADDAIINLLDSKKITFRETYLP